MHYLAIPPEHVRHCDRADWPSRAARKDARVIVEKPFGRDLASAQELNATLHQSFPERRFSASTTIWARRRSESALFPLCQLASWSRSGTATMSPVSRSRWPKTSAWKAAARFYEEVGAIRDVVQNHMLQVTSLLAMDAAGRPRHGIACATKSCDCSEPCARSTRPKSCAASSRGYRDEPGVAADSQVETFVALRLHIDTSRWAGVPFYIRAGKCLPVTATEVMVELKRRRRRYSMSSAPASRTIFASAFSPDVRISHRARGSSCRARPWSAERRADCCSAIPVTK